MARKPEVAACQAYTWYLSGLGRDTSFASSREFRRARTAWLTPQFAGDYEARVRRTDADPLLAAQDFEASWATNQEASLMSRAGRGATICMRFGKGTGFPHAIMAKLKQVNGRWAIDGVVRSTSPTACRR